MNSPHKWLVTRKMFPFDDVIMYYKVRNSIKFKTIGCKHTPKSNIFCNVCLFRKAMGTSASTGAVLRSWKRHGLETLSALLDVPFVRRIHRSLMDSPHKGPAIWSFDLTNLLSALIQWMNCRVVGDLRRDYAYATYCDVHNSKVMPFWLQSWLQC